MTHWIASVHGYFLFFWNMNKSLACSLLWPVRENALLLGGLTLLDKAPLAYHAFSHRTLWKNLSIPPATNTQNSYKECVREKMEILGASLGIHPIDPHNKEGIQVKSEENKLAVWKIKVLNRLRHLNASFPADVLFGKA